MKKYTALVRMKIPSPGNIPSSIRLAPGDIFSLDGNEGLDVAQLLLQGSIKEYKEPHREVTKNEPISR